MEVSAASISLYLYIGDSGRPGPEAPLAAFMALSSTGRRLRLQEKKSGPSWRLSLNRLPVLVAALSDCLRSTLRACRHDTQRISHPLQRLKVLNQVIAFSLGQSKSKTFVVAVDDLADRLEAAVVVEAARFV